MSEVIWKSVVGYEGHYEVSNLGEVRSIARILPPNKYGFCRPVPEKIISIWYNHRGYKMVSLHKEGKKGFSIHSLVAKAFVDNPHNKPEVNHLDGNKENNCPSNLEWATRLENQQHSVYTLGKHFAGENHYKAKLTVDNVIKIRELYRRRIKNMAEIGRQYDIDRGHVSKIINGTSWKTLKTKDKCDINQ